MRKQRIKHYLKLGILLFGVSMVFVNCQKEETLEHNEETVESNSSEFSRVSINDLIKNDETFSKLSENYLTDKISKKGYSARNSSNDLIMTSDTINVVEKENYKSYTIRIKRSGHEYDTENLIIEQKDSIESAYILSYNFDNEWVANRLKGIHNPTKGKIYYSEFDTSNLSFKSVSAKSSGNCNYITITIIAPCGCGHYYSPPCTGSTCGGNLYPTTYTTSQLVCDSGGGNDNDFGGPLPTDNGNEGGFGGGFGGGPSPSDPNDNSETQSSLEDMTEIIESKINKLITNLDLNTEQAEWVAENIEKSLDIYDYVAKKNSWANDAKNFAKAAVVAGVNGTLVTAFPLIKYPENSNYETLYPKLTEYLKNKLPSVGDIPLIVNTINTITDLTSEQIKNDLRWGQGPTINIIQLDNFGVNTSEFTVGFFKAATPNDIYLDIDYVNKLENDNLTQYEKDALLFYLGTTILHEYVHYGDNQDGVDYPGEEGQLFEILVYGENVTSTNAALILNDK